MVCCQLEGVLKRRYFSFNDAPQVIVVTYMFNESGTWKPPAAGMVQIRAWGGGGHGGSGAHAGGYSGGGGGSGGYNSTTMQLYGDEVVSFTVASCCMGDSGNTSVTVSSYPPVVVNATGGTAGTSATCDQYGE